MGKFTNFEIGQKAHQLKLLKSYQRLARRLLEKTITQDKFAAKLTSIHLKLEGMADRDSLIPDFFNYRGFQKALPQAIQTVFRLKTTGSLLFMDVDQLKRFNDKYGHLGGTRLLKIYGQVIEQVTRDTDLKSRLGGDEFAVFLVGANSQNAVFVANRIRNSVIDKIRKNFPDIGWQQTISIGICEAEEGASPEQLIHRADLALYQAKQERNKTIIFQNGPKVLI